MGNCVWNLSEANHKECSTDFQITSKDVPGTPTGWSVTKRTLKRGTSAGVELVEIDNGRMKLYVIPSRGMGLWRAEMDGERLGWNSPVCGPVHPNYVSLMEPTGVGWLDGFDELMVRCGLESNGSAVFDPQGKLIYPLHGRIANKPAHSLQLSVDASIGTITLLGVVDEIRFHYQKLRLTTKFVTTFGGTNVRWCDSVVNLSGLPSSMQMIYHINIGEPLLAPGAQFFAPLNSVSPHDYYPDGPGINNFHTYPALGPTPMQQSFFLELLADPTGATEVLLKHPEGERGLSVRFNKNILPWLTLWRNNTHKEDGYVTSIEPGTNFPNPRPFEEERGRIVRLAPSSEWRAEVTMEWLTGHSAISMAENRIAELQAGKSPEIHDQPLANYSAKASV